MMTFRSKFFALTGAALVALPIMAFAGEADVVDAKAVADGNGSYRFDVTVRHADSGWDHYADAFEILTEDGAVLGVRKLLHPHETEQPFTRSLSGVEVPSDISKVRVRAHDSVHEYGGVEILLELPDRQ